MNTTIINTDVIGFVHPKIDVHTLGITNIANLIESCGYKTKICDVEIASAIQNISYGKNIIKLKRWIKENKITILGFSYRLDPYDAQKLFGKFLYQLKRNNILGNENGKIKKILFAGLPKACELIQKEYHSEIVVFKGDETLTESVKKLGIPSSHIPREIIESSKYDSSRFDFGKKLIEDEKYFQKKPIDRSGYLGFGTKKDHVVNRINYARSKGQLPLIRAHVGLYKPNYKEAIKESNLWFRKLAKEKWLDILSIGSSQLSQSNFGENWEDKPNGGGIPINSELELREIWEVSRPMLLRIYAGTKNIPQLARIYEDTINTAWHALSFWWFCKIDGRGPNTVRYNLEEHINTLKFIANSNKPFEPNIPHHFSFRGADDYTYVLSGYIAAKTAKYYGIQNFVLQIMLNTPKNTWGIQDLAKGRALLKLVKELEDENFKVFLQPRAGLDYFSPDLQKAKMQLASVTAMMDDIDPLNIYSPDIIHVVSYSEAVKLATPEIINESIKITFQALEDYRFLKSSGKIENIAFNNETTERTEDLYSQVKESLILLEKNYLDLYTANGLYQIFKDGVFPVPHLVRKRKKYKDAVKWNTKLINGSVKVINEKKISIQHVKRIEAIIAEKLGV